MILQSNSHIADLPEVNIPRSTVNRSWREALTFDSGKLVPVFVDEILPGQTRKLNSQWLCRMSTPIVPVLDDAYLDYFYFFVPNRLVWTHWSEFLGENKASDWANQATYSVPEMSIDLSLCKPHSLMDYMGLPVPKSDSAFGHRKLKINAMPFRAYHLIWNEFFRDQNVQDPLQLSFGDTVTISEMDILTRIQSVCKYHDYFSSCLPQPQKGADVPIPISLTYSRSPLRDSNDLENLQGFSESLGSYKDAIYLKAEPDDVHSTISALRLAFATQRLLEHDARGGTRYTELLAEHFGVVNSDGLLQRPQYLGGGHVRLDMHQVVQQSGTTSTSPLGDTAAFSRTLHAGDNDVNYTFTEHGYFFCLACVRPLTSYANRIDRMWTRRDRLDFYFPSLANISEQPVYSREVAANFSYGGDTADISRDPTVFGYQEAFADYRYKQSEVKGLFRPGVTGSIGEWTYAQDFTYKNSPTLSPVFVVQDDTSIDRVLAVPSQPQFLLNALFTEAATLPMPTYSVPGAGSHF